MRAVLILIYCGLLIACDRPTVVESAPVVSLHTELGGDASGYQRVCDKREFQFPQDHGAHTEYRNEWWYVTGNLRSNRNTDIGFHVTFFRIANQPESTPSTQSAWDATQFYMGHFALSESSQPRTHAHERFSRAAAGLAGATVESGETRVWIDNWSVKQTTVDGQQQWLVSLQEGDESLQLTLLPEKPIVMQGEDGYSQKSADPCNASHYYSMSRLNAEGMATIDGVAHHVEGTAWFDREWSSSALGDDQVGWDWFALQMDDGRDIMFYQLRKQDGTADPFSHAVVIDKQGKKTDISVPSLQIDRWWKSESGASYPVAGKLTFAHSDEVIVFEPLIDNQELVLTVRYWEGAIRLSDINGKRTGHGYLELTGY